MARLMALGGVVRIDEPVEEVVVDHGRATGVRTTKELISARYAVLAACDAQLLYGHLVAEDLRAAINTLVLAVIVHLLHGMYNVGNLVIYAAAAWVVTVGKGPQA